MKFIDLFCGCGLFSEGMKIAGHKAVLGIDIWKTACQSYEANHTEALCTDILSLDPTTLPKIDLLIGSPPCQDFSNANIKRQENPILINKFVEIVEALKPKYWIMEEVPHAIKYVPTTWTRKLLDASSYGAVKRRKRLFAGKYKLVLASALRKPSAPTVMASWRKLAYKNKNPTYQTSKRILQYFNFKQPSIEEMKMLMGVRQDYIVCGSSTDQKHQLGNAVFVPLITELGKPLLEDEIYVPRL